MTTSNDGPRLSPAARVFLGVQIVAATAAVVWSAGAVTASDVSWTNLALVASLAVTIAVPTLMVARPSSYVVAAEEVFLLPALAWLGGPSLVLGVAVGATAGRVIARLAAPTDLMRATALQPVRFGFNVSSKIVGSVLAVGVFSAFDLEPTATGNTVRAAAATLAFTAHSVLAVGVIRHLTGAVRVVDHVREELSSVSLLTTFGNLLLGVLLAFAVLTSAWPVVWIAATLLYVVVSSARTRQVTQERDRLAELAAAADAMFGVHDRDTAEHIALTHARQLTDSGHAELRTTPPSDGELGVALPDDSARWLVVAGRTTPGAPYAREDLAALRGLVAMATSALATTGLVEDLRRSDELKSDLIAAVAHDLRAPVASAAGLLRTVHDRYLSLDPETTRELLSAGSRATQRALDLIDDLLDLKRVDHGVRTTPPTVDVAAVVRSLLPTLDLPEPVLVETEGTRTNAAIDEIKLSRVLDNLIRNAARHSPAGSIVRVTYEPRDGGALVSVCDRGSGVPKEIRDRIFHPFERGDTPRGRGVGLGLYVARRFVEFHHGRIWVEDAPGGGAAFRIWLPSSAPAAPDVLDAHPVEAI